MISSLSHFPIAYQHNGLKLLRYFYFFLVILPSPSQLVTLCDCAGGFATIFLSTFFVSIVFPTSTDFTVLLCLVAGLHFQLDCCCTRLFSCRCAALFTYQQCAIFTRVHRTPTASTFSGYGTSLCCRHQDNTTNCLAKNVKLELF